MSCGVGHRHGSDSELLWLWRRPAAAAPIRPLAWKSPYATGTGTGLDKTKRQKKKKKKGERGRGRGGNVGGPIMGQGKRGRPGKKGVGGW